MKVAILLYPNCSLWSAFGPMELLLRANKAQQYFSNGKKGVVYFDIECVSSCKKGIKTYFNYPISSHTSIYNEKVYDLTIIPGFDYDLNKILVENKDAINWIKYQYKHNAKVASICTGSFLLAKTGILDNKRATTHWFLADSFLKMFPDIILCKKDIVIDHGDIFMSGGATSFQNLILLLIEKFMSREVAIGVSKIYLVDMHKDSQNSYSFFLTQKEHQDKEILKAQQIIEDNCSEKISISYLARELSMSKRNFIRRFKSATGDTPFQYIQKVKIENAKNKLEMEKKTFEEIAFEAGYEDVNAFRKLFIKQTNVTPSAYKKRYMSNLPIKQI